MPEWLQSRAIKHPGFHQFDAKPDMRIVRSHCQNGSREEFDPDFIFHRATMPTPGSESI